jgi:hypothetical protein
MSNQAQVPTSRRAGFSCMAEQGQQESCDVAVTELFVDGGFAQV